MMTVGDVGDGMSETETRIIAQPVPLPELGLPRLASLPSLRRDGWGSLISYSVELPSSRSKIKLDVGTVNRT